MDKVIIKDLLTRGIIGINDWEREQPQDILINIVVLTDTRRAAEWIAGSLRSIHSWNAAELAVNTKSSNSCMRSSAERKVALTSWKPSCHCQSQTGSMWALPIMCKVLLFTVFILLQPMVASASACWPNRRPATMISAASLSRRTRGP